MDLETVRADAVENGLVDHVACILGTGKEADVYLGLWKDAPLALKVYRLHRTVHRKKSELGYAIDMMGSLAAKEFTLLQKAYKAGVPVPTPARRVDNMFTMRFLGDSPYKAPLLKDAILEDPDMASHQAVGIVRKLLHGYMVHGDLSEYNLVYWNETLYLIDFPQAVDFSSRADRHIRAEEAKILLLRDLENLQRHFAKYNVQIDAASEYQRSLLRLECE